MVIYYALLAMVLSWNITASGASDPQKSSDSKNAKGKPSWADVPMEKRCEIFWAFITTTAAKTLPGWTMAGPSCEVAGGSRGDLSWALDFVAKKDAKSLAMRLAIQESPRLKPEVTWCLISNKKMGCAAPWESAFARGALFKNAESAKTAYAEVTAMSQGFVLLVTDVDAWAGRPGGDPVLFDVPFDEWVKGWVSATRSLPVKEGPFVADYQLDAKSKKSGLVTVKDLPKSLRECLGCAKPLCDGSSMTFLFSGLSLTITRELTREEEAAKGQKSASVSWLMLEPTPFKAGKGRWPMLCGEYRFNVQKD